MVDADSTRDQKAARTDLQDNQYGTRGHRVCNLGREILTQPDKASTGKEAFT